MNDKIHSRKNRAIYQFRIIYIIYINYKIYDDTADSGYQTLSA